jgi:hypothetical protein
MHSPFHCRFSRHCTTNIALFLCHYARLVFSGTLYILVLLCTECITYVRLYNHSLSHWNPGTVKCFQTPLFRKHEQGECYRQNHTDRTKWKSRFKESSGKLGDEKVAEIGCHGTNLTGVWQVSRRNRLPRSQSARCMPDVMLESVTMVNRCTSSTSHISSPFVHESG